MESQRAPIGSRGIEGKGTSKGARQAECEWHIFKGNQAANKAAQSALETGEVQALPNSSAKTEPPIDIPQLHADTPEERVRWKAQGATPDGGGGMEIK